MTLIYLPSSFYQTMKILLLIILISSQEKHHCEANLMFTPM